MPVRAAETFYNTLGNARFDPATKVQWLIDTPERLLQYQSLARRLGVRMRVNVEIDVGLHRGGLPEPEALKPLLNTIAADREHLTLSGFMGYEPHLTGLGATIDHPAVQDVLSRYRGFVDTARNAGVDTGTLTLNGAGSHTLRIYDHDATMNDLAAGSGVVKPTDFDTHHLNEHAPARVHRNADSEALRPAHHCGRPLDCRLPAVVESEHAAVVLHLRRVLEGQRGLAAGRTSAHLPEHEPEPRDDVQLGGPGRRRLSVSEANAERARDACSSATCSPCGTTS